MKRRKRIIAGMLAAIMVFTNVSVSAFANPVSGSVSENEITTEIISFL